MFWQKKPITEVKSDEFEQLNKKIISMVSDIDIMSNRLEIIDTIVKSNRARISKIKVDGIISESEKDIKDEPRYL